VPERVLDEATARAVWLRAAQLQADASRRIQERTSRAEEYATGMHAAVPTSGYRQGDVEAAAVEAGIAEEFVQLALAELPSDEAELPARYEAGDSRLQRFALGTVDRSLRVSKVIPAAPRAVLESVGRIFPASPYDLIFSDTVGGHPLDGGVLTFAVKPFTSVSYMEAGAMASLRYYLSVVDAYQLRVTLHPAAGDPRRCEIVVTADMRSGIRKNARIGFGFGAGMGLAGAGVGAGLSIAAGAAAAVVIPIAAAALGLAGGGMLGLFRVTYRWGVRRARRELEHLLDAVGANARSQDVFGLQAGAPKPLLPG
jgi:hypothetical protein